MKLNLVFSILLAAVIGLANQYLLIALWGMIANFILQSGFIEWYHHAHLVVSYYVFSLVSGFLLNVLFCVPIAFIALKLFHRWFWLHIAVISVAPRLADGFQIASLSDASIQMLLFWVTSLLMVPAAVTILSLAVHARAANSPTAH